ncbi:cell division protein FtsW [Rhodospirillum rubrum]|uniref:FtsW/RodA/SpoVE family cell cycle protein n=1 Tax=Rhodospirillum rubrum TaxID=1085 RepID=UPI001904AE7F|nr:putative peptidoglycan glycosyltransferase FtsW [Rhodospirillum rubrum]MBK1663974.1 cell division protein FtsW [Rhodospirillum rubrum]MBK1677532.1 cell division protein FtsW [Rhodospirillum rubrum]
MTMRVVTAPAEPPQGASHVAPSFTRMDTSVLGRWWWTVDRPMLGAVALLIAAGVFLILAAGPPAAGRIGAQTYHFVQRQFLFVPVASVLVIAVSLLPVLWVRRIAVLLFALFMVLLLGTLFVSSDIKGASRWIAIGPFALQPSEFVKPTFAVVTAWMFASARTQDRFPGNLIAMVLMAVVGALLVAQPDFGMTMVVACVWGTQFFLAGLSLVWVVLLAAVGMIGAVIAYFALPHVQSRVDRFLDPASGDQYQIRQSMKAFMEGGLFGRGPGEGRVKEFLPDAHTDFIFAVAGEEFGLFLCLTIVALFAFLIIRSAIRLRREQNLFVLIAAGGLLTQLGLQALINMASSLSLIPTKGMTLPFISYGGSSLLSTAVAMGMVLALTRRRAHGERT